MIEFWLCKSRLQGWGRRTSPPVTLAGDSRSLQSRGSKPQQMKRRKGKKKKKTQKFADQISSLHQTNYFPLGRQAAQPCVERSIERKHGGLHFPAFLSDIPSAEAMQSDTVNSLKTIDSGCRLQESGAPTAEPADLQAGGGGSRATKQLHPPWKFVVVIRSQQHKGQAEGAKPCDSHMTPGLSSNASPRQLFCFIFQSGE